MNTHPTHTHVWVGWLMGATAIDSPLRCRCVFLCLRCSLHTLENRCVFSVHLCVFRVFFGALVCVWKVFFVLSNIVKYRKKFLSIHLQIATPKTPAQSW